MNEKFLYVLDEDDRPSMFDNLYVFTVIGLLSVMAFALHVPGMP